MSTPHAESHTFHINFILSPQKQRMLLDVLLRHSQSDFLKLARALQIPHAKIKLVYAGDGFFNKEESKRVVQVFCMCCGE